MLSTLNVSHQGLPFQYLTKTVRGLALNRSSVEEPLVSGDFDSCQGLRSTNKSKV